MLSTSSIKNKQIHKAEIQAYIDPIVAPPPRGFCGGLVLSDSPDDVEFRHTRNHSAIDHFRIGEDYPDFIQGDAIYAGPIWDHFGHFMAEMIHRIIPSRLQFGNRDLVFVTTQFDTRLNSYSKLPPFIKDIFSYLEINSELIKIINRNTVLERACVVEQGSDLGGGPKGRYLDIVREFSERRLHELHRDDPKFSKLYVSRSLNRPGGNFLGELYLEGLLENQGYFIFRPEEYPFSRQLDIYSKSDIIIFPEGSACHCTELLGGSMMNRSYLLSRRDGHIRSFTNILKPRSQEFQISHAAKSIGTLVVERATGNPAEHVGVSTFDLEKLREFFKLYGLGNLDNFNESRYYEFAEKDLLEYFRYHIAAGNKICPPSDVASVFLRFEDTIKGRNP